MVLKAAFASQKSASGRLAAYSHTIAIRNLSNPSITNTSAAQIYKSTYPSPTKPLALSYNVWSTLYLSTAVCTNIYVKRFSISKCQNSSAS
jgi:hypothetical protein